MKTEKKVLVLSTLVGASLWIGDAAVDALFFSKEPFLDVLFLKATPYELYMRGIVFLAVFAIGLIAAVLLRRERKTRDALVESQRRFDAFMAHFPGIAFMRDREGRFVLINPGMAELLGRPASQVVGRQALDLLPQELAQSSMEEDRAILATGKPFEGEELVHYPSGPRHWRVSKFPIPDQQGEVGLVGCVSVDISGLKKVEGALREAEELYRTLVENLGEGVNIVDPAETFLFVNPAGEAIFGVPPGSLVGRNLREFLSEEEFERAKKHTTQRRRGVTNTYESRITRPDGEIRDLRVTATPRRSGDGMYAATLAVFSDITDLKRAEEALRESEERYRTLFHRTNDGILILDSDGKILEINEALCLRLQYSREELLGKGIGAIDPPEFAKLVPERVRDVVKSGSAVFETVHLRRDGTPIQTEISTRAITYQGRAAILSIARDITERKHVEAEKARTKDLQTIARLAQGMAHEVRNPLFAIEVNVSALAKRVVVGPEAQAHMDYIIAHVKRLDDLVRSLMELGESIGPDEMADADLRAILHAACTAVREEFADRRVGFELEDGGQAVPLRTSVRKMTLAFIHLLRNAAQVSSEGGLVRIAFAQEPKACRIIITDQGPGIPEKVRATLFEPFITTRVGQPGMGLALARHYLESHGGTITAESNHSTPGATFTVRIPL